jgi:hypothetical protein
MVHPPETDREAADSHRMADSTRTRQPTICEGNVKLIKSCGYLAQSRRLAAAIAAAFADRTIMALIPAAA